MNTFKTLADYDSNSQEVRDLLQAQAEWEQFNQETRLVRGRTRPLDDAFADRTRASRRVRKLARALGMNPEAWGIPQHHKV